MPKKKDFDLIILGSGIAGSTAFSLAKQTGKKIAIIEPEKWGGSALNDTDLPARALLNFSHLYSDAVRGTRFGLASRALSFDYSSTLAWRNLVSRRAGTNSKKPYLSPASSSQPNAALAHLALISGRASFVSPFEISVRDKLISGKNFLISTGARLNTSGISGVNSASCLSPAEALRLPALPASIFIVGGGTSGCELANYFAELGVSVSLAESASRLLPREDEEVGRLLKTYFESVLKMKVFTQTRVVAAHPSALSSKKSAESTSNGTSLTLLRGGRERTLSAPVVILATGYTSAFSDLNLDTAGVKTSPSGIVVDDFLRTSAHHIFAAGDVLGAP